MKRRACCLAMKPGLLVLLAGLRAALPGPHQPADDQGRVVRGAERLRGGRRQRRRPPVPVGPRLRCCSLLMAAIGAALSMAHAHLMRPHELFI